MTPLAEAFLGHAVAAIGVHEDPGHPNSGRWIDEYLAFVGLQPGQPWCAAAASLWLHKAATDLGLTVELPKTGSSSQMYLWFLKRRLITKHPEPGMAGFLRGGPTGHRHTFVVEHLTPSGFSVLSVDANEGDRVERISHPVISCDFGNVGGLAP